MSSLKRSKNEISNYHKNIYSYLKNNIRLKKGIFKKNKEMYFYGNEAVDTILNGIKNNKIKCDKNLDREKCSNILQSFINIGYIKRMERLLTPCIKSTKTDDEFEEEDKNVKKNKYKVKLKIHEDNIFYDSKDNTYMLIYKPMSLTNILLGVAIIFAVILYYLQPLWPESLRTSIGYLGYIAMGLLGLLLILNIVRLLLFIVVWLYSYGYSHFWIFPNLNADCGVIESFKPFYSLKYKKISKTA